MVLLKRSLLLLLLVFVLLVAAINIWGLVTLGTLEPAEDPTRNDNANDVVMVFGATGSVGDGLLKAAMDAPEVEKIYVVTRSMSPRIEAGAASGELEVIQQEDFEDYSNLAEILPEVNTVLWALGLSSLQVDDETYTWIHVDFPVAFVKEWLAGRTAAPMSFHSVTGMGTDAEGDAHWAREKGRAEREVAAMADGTGLRTFAYHSGYIRPPDDVAHAGHYILEALLTPGAMVITSEDLAHAMFEISARSEELPNGTIIDHADSIAYARAYKPGAD